MRSGKTEHATSSDFQIFDKSEIMETLRLHFDRRSGIERRHISYLAHIPERRSGRDRRISDDLWKEVDRTQSGSKLLKALYGSDHNLAE
jgi:hypothetical protein